MGRYVPYPIALTLWSTSGGKCVAYLMRTQCYLPDAYSEQDLQTARGRRDIILFHPAKAVVSLQFRYREKCMVDKDGYQTQARPSSSSGTSIIQCLCQTWTHWHYQLMVSKRSRRKLNLLGSSSVFSTCGTLGKYWISWNIWFINYKNWLLGILPERMRMKRIIREYAVKRRAIRKSEGSWLWWFWDALSWQCFWN